MVTIKEVGNRVQIRLNNTTTDAKEYALRRYIHAQYLEAKGAIKIKDGYSFPLEWAAELRQAASVDISKQPLF